MLYKGAAPYEGRRYAHLDDDERRKLTLLWSRCASFLDKPARPIVKKGVVDLSWYHDKSIAA